MLRKFIFITVALTCLFFLTPMSAMAARGAENEQHKNKHQYINKQQEEEEKEKKKSEVRKAPVKPRGDQGIIKHKEKKEIEVRKHPRELPKKHDNNKHEVRKHPQELPKKHDNNKYEVRKHEGTKRDDKGPVVKKYPGTVRNDQHHRENLRLNWEKERLEIRKRQGMQHHIRSRIYHERRIADHHWHRHYSDWNWLGGHSFLNIRLYNSRYSDSVWSVRFHTHRHRHPHFFEMMTQHYGHHGFKKRWHHDEIYGWAFYWVGPHTVVRLVIDDDGNMYTALWNRDELERSIIEVGYMSASSFEYYRSYERMPYDVMEKYVEDVVDTVEYED